MENQSANSDESAKPENVIIFKKEFFDEKDFIERFDHEMKVIRTLISRKDNQENIKTYLNAFAVTCFESIKDEEIRLHMHLEFFKTFSFYGEIFKSRQTFENIIKNIEQKDLKEKLFTKYPLRSFMVYGETLLKYYGIENEKNEGWFTPEGFEIILKAKFYLLKAYTQSTEGKNKLSESDFSYCLVLLSGCFMSLSRWFEPIFYLKLLKSRDLEDPNHDYLTALNLDALKEKSCLDYNGQLLLRILDCCTNTINNPNVDERQKQHLSEILESCNKDIQKAKLSVANLRKHNKKVNDSKRRRNVYFTYCIKNQLFLNEHSFFCNCGRSIGDTLEIKTSHPHTQMDGVGKFEKLLDTICSDFALARYNLFQSESTHSSIPFYKKEHFRSNSMQLRKDAYLKNAFKICYSILDQICYGIFEGFEIDIDKFLKEKFGDESFKNSKIYFLNMWDLYNFTVPDFINNIYLISLQSIAKDLDKTDYSALKSFKDYRNAMEHKILFIEGEKNNKPGFDLNTCKVVKRSELLAKTQLLMILTKSAIFSFTYFIRRQSKLKEMAMKAE